MLMNLQSIFNRRFTSVGLTLFSVALGYVVPVRAEDNTVTTFDGVTTNWAVSPFYVGNTGTNNVLTISGGGVLTNISTLYIGNATGANQNSATVTGAGSKLLSSTYGYIGSSGSSNVMTIANGGLVNLGALVLGNALGSQGRDNALVVSGADSRLNLSGEHTIGKYAGGFNTLLISNGGIVYNSSASRLGGGDTGNDPARYNSSNNSARVTGVGSLWSNASHLSIGYWANGNTLTISDGGRVSSLNGRIGYRSASSNNEVVVTGIGSVWDNASGIYVGNEGTLNMENCFE